MQLIDEKGKIFGKVNIIDLALIVFTILVLITGYKYLYLKNYPENVLDKLTGSKEYWVNVTTLNFIPVEILNQINVGDVTKSNDVLSNKTIGKILKIDSDKNTLREFGKKITYSILVKKRPNEIIYQNERIYLGKEFIFDTELYSLSGKIIKIEP